MYVKCSANVGIEHSFICCKKYYYYFYIYRYIDIELFHLNFNSLQICFV